MTDTLSDTSTLTQLGRDTRYEYDTANPKLLERFPNPMKSARGRKVVRVVAPEFTSLCPLTGQPDYATIVLEYTPRDWCLESKSWKVYLMSFRNIGEFHESCITRMHNDLVTLLDPEWMMIEGQFTPRGGISFWPRIDYTREG